MDAHAAGRVHARRQDGGQSLEPLAVEVEHAPLERVHVPQQLDGGLALYATMGVLQGGGDGRSWSYVPDRRLGVVAERREVVERVLIVSLFVFELLTGEPSEVWSCHRFEALDNARPYREAVVGTVPLAHEVPRPAPRREWRLVDPRRRSLRGADRAVEQVARRPLGRRLAIRHRPAQPDRTERPEHAQPRLPDPGATARGHKNPVRPEVRPLHRH